MLRGFIPKNTFATKKSLYTHKNWNVANAAIPATESGSANRKNVVKWEAPSILADSITLLGKLIMKSRNKNVARGKPKPVWANHTATNVPFIFNSGTKGIPNKMAPLFISFSNGINDICKGTIIIATTKRKAISFPRKSIKAKAYAANAAIVIGIIVDGIVTAKELKNDLLKFSANKISV